jgi:hypothetical protein
MLQKCADAGVSGVGFELGNVEGCQLGEVEYLCCQRAADAVDC